MHGAHLDEAGHEKHKAHANQQHGVPVLDYPASNAGQRGFAEEKLTNARQRTSGVNGTAFQQRVAVALVIIAR